MRLLDRILRREMPVDLPPLADGERVAAWGSTPEGAAAVATNLGLWLPLKQKPVIHDVRADATDQVPAEPGAADEAGAPVVAVEGAAAGGAPAPAAGERWQRLGWAEIHKAVWAEETLTITPGVEVEPGVVADARLRRLRLSDPRDLPAEVRTRVNRSVAHTSQHRLVGGGSVRVVARRVPGVDGLTWQLRFDNATDRAKPGVRAEAEGILTEVRALTTPS
jgi:hypothetical protein